MHPDDAKCRLHSKIAEKQTSQLSSTPQCCIYRVHNGLRNVNDKAYEPRIIAIGPHHRNKDNLKLMEDNKWRYFLSLLKRKGENGERFVSAVAELEQQARECYAEPVCLSYSDFIEMLVLDGCFIIELVRKHSEQTLRHTNDDIFHLVWMKNSLRRDLLLFENQIPFFVLLKLFDLIHGVPGQHNLLIALLVTYLSSTYPFRYAKDINTSTAPQEVKHLLDLIHITSFRPSFASVLHIEAESTSSTTQTSPFIHSASSLKLSNIKFEKRTSSDEDLFKIEFNQGILSLPPLMVDDGTEVFFRNLIAYEQYLRDAKVTKSVTDYVAFMDSLIDSPWDVEILRRHGIMDSWVGDDEILASMFNKLGESVIASSCRRSVYAEIHTNVLMHCQKRQNRWMNILKREYFNNPWKIISLFAAAVLLVLTITQTVCAILQVALR